MPITDPTEMGESIDNVISKLKADPSYPADFSKAHPDGIRRRPSRNPWSNTCSP